MDAAEARVEAAPARDAMDVQRDLDGRQLLELAPGQAERFLDFAADREVPRREVGLRHGARMEDGPFLGQVMPGRQAGRVVAGVCDLLLGFGAEHDAYTN